LNGCRPGDRPLMPEYNLLSEDEEPKPCNSRELDGFPFL
jgi:hypothetical protein